MIRDFLPFECDNLINQSVSKPRNLFGTRAVFIKYFTAGRSMKSDKQ